MLIKSSGYTSVRIFTHTETAAYHHTNKNFFYWVSSPVWQKNLIFGYHILYFREKTLFYYKMVWIRLYVRLLVVVVCGCGTTRPSYVCVYFSIKCWNSIPISSWNFYGLILSESARARTRQVYVLLVYTIYMCHCKYTCAVLCTFWFPYTYVVHSFKSYFLFTRFPFSFSFSFSFVFCLPPHIAFFLSQFQIFLCDFHNCFVFWLCCTVFPIQGFTEHFWSQKCFN